MTQNTVGWFLSGTASTCIVHRSCRLAHGPSCRARSARARSHALCAIGPRTMDVWTSPQERRGLCQALDTANAVEPQPRGRHTRCARQGACAFEGIKASARHVHRFGVGSTQLGVSTVGLYFNAATSPRNKCVALWPTVKKGFCSVWGKLGECQRPPKPQVTVRLLSLFHAVSPRSFPPVVFHFFYYVVCICFFGRRGNKRLHRLLDAFRRFVFPNPVHCLDT